MPPKWEITGFKEKDLNRSGNIPEGERYQLVNRAPLWKFLRDALTYRSCGHKVIDAGHGDNSQTSGHHS